MSVRLLLEPNNFNLYANNLTLAENLTVDGSLDVNTLNVDTFVITGTDDSTNVSTGALVVNGGVGIGKNVTLGQSLYLPTSGGTQTGLSYYETATITLLLNLFTSTALVCKFIRIGNNVTFDFPTWLHQYSSLDVSPLTYGSFAGQIPTRFRPNSDKTYYSRVSWQDSALDPVEYLDGYVTITSTGMITWYTYNKTDPQYTLNVGSLGASFSWSI